jgi:hypothetical protein
MSGNVGHRHPAHPDRQQEFVRRIEDPLLGNRIGRSRPRVLLR